MVLKGAVDSIASVLTGRAARAPANPGATDAFPDASAEDDGKLAAVPPTWCRAPAAGALAAPSAFNAGEVGRAAATAKTAAAGN
jgi:hypothetical protein